MKAVKSVAAIGVLLCGVAMAQSHKANGVFTFTVPASGIISCTSPEPVDIIENKDVVIPVSGSAVKSPSEVVCTIKTIYDRWDLQVNPSHSGFLISGGDTLKIDNKLATLAIYATLKNSEEEGFNPIKVAAVDTDYEHAVSLNPFFEAPATKTFTLAAALSSVENGHFIVDGATEATLIVKGAPRSATESTRVTSGPGDYVETLEFEIVTVF